MIITDHKLQIMPTQTIQIRESFIVVDLLYTGRFPVLYVSHPSDNIFREYIVKMFYSNQDTYLVDLRQAIFSRTVYHLGQALHVFLFLGEQQ